MPEPLTAREKEVARHVSDAFGAKGELREYLDDSDRMKVNILRCDGKPFDGVISWSTVGLSDTKIPWGGNEFPTRIEIAGVSAGSDVKFANLLASVAFHMMKSGDVYHPGAAIDGYVRLYFPDSPLTWLYFTTPFSWALRPFETEGQQVTWLQAMSISSAERAFLHEKGDIAIEKLFAEKRVVVQDLTRASVV